MFLGREFDNLYTLDILCAGVCSHKVFGEYVTYKYLGSAIIIVFVVTTGFQYFNVRDEHILILEL